MFQQESKFLGMELGRGGGYAGGRGGGSKEPFVALPKTFYHFVTCKGLLSRTYVRLGLIRLISAMVLNTR